MIGKVIRARPQYIKFEYFNNLKQKIVDTNNELFFNQGRSALKFFLQCYSKYLNRDLIIAMQSFNCRVVADAALEANCKIYLFDIKLIDFSIDVNSLEKCTPRPDVLLLTHYQGIPNVQYEKIINYCVKSNILIIDDISQTEQTYIRNKRIGSLGHFALRSFAFDKPYSTLEGGSLVINKRVSKEFKIILIQEYDKIQLESKRKSKNDLKTLKFLLKYSDQKYYHKGLNNLPVLRLYSWIFGFKAMYWLSMFIKFNSFVRELLRKNSLNKQIKILKLRSDKISFLLLQKLNDSKSNINLLEKIAFHINLTPVSIKDAIIKWNRYSIIDKNNVMKELLINNNIEASNYNWPETLHVLFKDNKQIIKNEKYINSEFCSKNILNIPLWKDLDFIDTNFKVNAK